MHLGSKSSMEYREYFLLRNVLPELKISRNTWIGGYFSYRGGGEGVMSCISVLNCSMKDQEIFYSEMFFQNSKFHEIRQLEGCFHPQGSRAGGKELYLGFRFFSQSNWNNFYLINVSENKVCETGTNWLPKKWTVIFAPSLLIYLSDLLEKL